MKMLLSILAASCLGLTAGFSGDHTAEGSTAASETLWLADLDAATQLASETGRPLLAAFR